MSSPALGRPKSDTCKFGHTFTQGSTRQFCQECKNRATQRWREAHPERFRELKRKQSLRDNFNLTHEDYQAMWKEQKGLCAACGNPMPEKDDRGYFPPVDHDHITGKVRGIVHGTCNRGMGYFSDNPERMRRVAEYLEKNQ